MKREEWAEILNIRVAEFIYQLRYDDARAYVDQAVLENRESRGIDSWGYSHSIYYLACLLAREGNYAEAESLYRHAMVIDEALYGTGIECHWDDRHTFGEGLALTLLGLLDIYCGQERFADAALLYSRFLKIREQRGDWHPRTIQRCHEFITAYHQKTKNAEVELSGGPALTLYAGFLKVAFSDYRSAHPELTPKQLRNVQEGIDFALSHIESASRRSAHTGEQEGNYRAFE